MCAAVKDKLVTNMYYVILKYTSLQMCFLVSIDLAHNVVVNNNTIVEYCVFKIHSPTQ